MDPCAWCGEPHHPLDCPVRQEEEREAFGWLWCLPPADVAWMIRGRYEVVSPALERVEPSEKNVCHKS